MSETTLSRRTIALILAGVLLFGGSIGLAWIFSDPESGAPFPPPPSPAWVRPDGSVDLSKVPEWIPVMAGDGTDRIKGYARGEDSFATDGRPVYLYDQPNGRVIGRADGG